jgi:hypothetical protein
MISYTIFCWVKQRGHYLPFSVLFYGGPVPPQAGLPKWGAGEMGKGFEDSRPIWASQISFCLGHDQDIDEKIKRKQRTREKLWLGTR